MTRVQKMSSPGGLASLALLASLAAAPAARAAGPAFVPVGPDEGEVASLAVSWDAAGTVYAGTARTLARSRDHGASWETFQLLGPGPAGLEAPVSGIAVSPADAQTLYLSRSAGPVSVSHDGGATWRDTAFDACGGCVLAFAPSAPNVVYALGYTYAPVRRSEDGGATVVAQGFLPLDGYTPIALAVDPRNAWTAYAALNQGFYRTEDGGATWVLVTDQGPFNSGSLVIQPQTRAFYATTRNGSFSGILKSTDQGRTWRRAGAGLALSADNEEVEALALDPQEPGTLYLAVGRQILAAAGTGGRIFKSTDGAASWRQVARSADSILTLAVDPRRSQRVFAGTSHGVLSSRDHGTSWSFSAKGLSGGGIEALAADPHTPGRIYAGVRSGSVDPVYRFWRSDDHGDSWTALGRGLPDGPLSSLVPDPVTPDLLYAATAAGIWRSRDAGSSFERLGLEGESILDLAVSPADPGTLYAVGGARGPFSLGSAWKSVDGGRTWNVLTGDFGGFFAITLDPRDPQRIFLRTRSSGSRVALPRGHSLQSRDGGKTWKAIDIGAGAGRVLVDPSTGTLYAATDRGIEASDDQGESWTFAGNGQGFGFTFKALAADPRNPAVLYAGTDGVYTSTGSHGWGPFAPGPAFRVTQLAVDPFEAGTVYAGTTGSGVVRFRRAAGACEGSATVLCLADRFSLAVTGPAPTTGSAPVAGTAWPIGGATGAFWFFDPRNLDLAVKLLDGRAVNGRFWVFVGAATDAPYTLTVTDTATAEVFVVASHSPGKPLSFADTSTFGPAAGHAATALDGPGQPPGTTLSPGGGFSLLGGRFRIEVTMELDRAPIAAPGAALTEGTGYAWLFAPGNAELLVKVVDGRFLNGKFWVFYAPLTDLGYTLTVTDTATGAQRVYRGSPGRIAGGADTAAF